MNTVNVLTGFITFTPFQLHFGKSPCILPPLILLDDDDEQNQTAHNIMEQMQPIKLEAKDSLLTVKITQAQQQTITEGTLFHSKLENASQHTGNGHTSQVTTHTQLSSCHILMACTKSF